MSQVLVPRLSFKNDRISEDITCKIFNAKTGNKSNAGTPINEFSPFLNLGLNFDKLLYKECMLSSNINNTWKE